MSLAMYNARQLVIKAERREMAEEHKNRTDSEVIEWLRRNLRPGDIEPYCGKTDEDFREHEAYRMILRGR